MANSVIPGQCPDCPHAAHEPKGYSSPASTRCSQQACTCRRTMRMDGRVVQTGGFRHLACPACRRNSHHPQDLAEEFCSNCKTYGVATVGSCDCHTRGLGSAADELALHSVIDTARGWRACAEQLTTPAARAVIGTTIVEQPWGRDLPVEAIDACAALIGLRLAGLLGEAAGSADVGEQPPRGTGEDRS